MAFYLLSFYLHPANTKRTHPKWDLGKDFCFKAFIKSEQLRRLLNDQNYRHNVLDSGKPYQFEPPVLEQESYASDTLDGLKRECTVHLLYKWLLRKRRCIIEMNTFRNSSRKFCDLYPNPRCFSVRFLLRSHSHWAPLWMRMQMPNGIVIQSDSHSYTTRCDVMFLSIAFCKTKVIIILVFWCSYVKKKTVYLWPFNHAHLVWEHLMS